MTYKAYKLICVKFSELSIILCIIFLNFDSTENKLKLIEKYNNLKNIYFYNTQKFVYTVIIFMYYYKVALSIIKHNCFGRV